MIAVWAVTLTYELRLDQAEQDRLADLLDSDYDASIFAIPDGRVMVTYWTDGPDPVKAAGMARTALHDLMHEPVGISVVAEADYLERADAPTLPRLVSAPEVAELLGGVSRQRVHQLRSLPAFPAPLYELRTGPIWDESAVLKFAREWERKPGRPPSKR